MPQQTSVEEPVLGISATVLTRCAAVTPGSFTNDLLADPRHGRSAAGHRPTDRPHGMAKSPRRRAHAYAQMLTCGSFDLSTFANAERYDELTLVGDIPVRSACEHHMLRSFGSPTWGSCLATGSGAENGRLPPVAAFSAQLIADDHAAS